MAKLCVGHHFALDGIGSNKNNDNRYVRDPYGFFKLEHGIKDEIDGAPTEFAIDDLASARGTGADGVILNALRYIDDRYKRSGYGQVKRINLIGFSRGAVCCTLLSWLIYGVLSKRQIPLPDVNMFLFDPVAGGLNAFKGHMKYRGTQYRTDRTRLPPNVKNFSGIIQAFTAAQQYQLFGWAFNSTMPKPSSSNTTYDVLVMPGGHSASSLYDVSGTGTPLGMVGLTLAQDFLMQHKTHFLNDVRLSTCDMAEAYAQVRVENDFADKGANDANMTFFQQGRFLRSAARRTAVNRHRKISDHPFWVNVHHKRLMQQLDAVLSREIDWLAVSKRKQIAKSSWDKLNRDRRMTWTAAALKSMGFAPT
ncbi:MAG: hypothetical protein ACFB03_23180 [Paracoccaceae bacterium]